MLNLDLLSSTQTLAQEEIQTDVKIGTNRAVDTAIRPGL